jgi:hypothetical protein
MVKDSNYTLSLMKDCRKQLGMDKDIVIPENTIVYIVSLKEGITKCHATGIMYALPWVNVKELTGAYTIDYNCSLSLEVAIKLFDERKKERLSELENEIIELNKVKMVFDRE